MFRRFPLTLPDPLIRISLSSATAGGRSGPGAFSSVDDPCEGWRSVAFSW